MPADRRTRALLLAFALTSSACAPLESQEADRWMADFDALLRHLPQGYANLEYAVRDARMDVAGAVARTRQRLRDARSNGAARDAIEDFLTAFGDMHVSVVDAQSESGTSANPRSCKDLGFRSRDRRFHKSITAQPGFKARSGNFLPVATLDGGHLAVRIPLFSQTQFPDACETLWPIVASGRECDNVCRTKLFRAIGDSVIADLRRQLAVTASSPSPVLVVDITGNGGGSEWVVELARHFSVNALSQPAIGMVRHDHWRRALERRKMSAATGRDSAAADALLSTLATPCDWSAIWSGGAPPPCSPVVTSPATQLAPPDQPVWKGRIVIVADERTASAAEEFAAMLVDGGIAKVVGTRTMGIGCGFTNGGIDFRLPNSGLRVRLPDCARFRRDGTNERAGISPDAGTFTGEAAHDARLLAAAISRVE